jgi:hypothetical protein
MDISMIMELPLVYAGDADIAKQTKMMKWVSMIEPLRSKLSTSYADP